MPDPFIGIPILNRVDLLERCLAAIDVPAEIVILNNNSVNPAFTRYLHDLTERHRAQVLDQPRNLGVSASWNLLARMAFERGREWLFIGSNDTFLRPGSLSAAAECAADEPRVGIWHIHSANFFLLHKNCIDSVGWFDENFYPAYKEDQDYSHRCILAGVERKDVPAATLHQRNRPNETSTAIEGEAVRPLPFKASCGVRRTHQGRGRHGRQR